MAKFNRHSLYYFRYRPKLRETLPFWDRQPLMFPLRITNTHTLGINIHWVPAHIRNRFLNWLIDNSKKIKNQKRFARQTYNVIKSTSGLRAVATNGIRLYINNNASNVKEITREELMSAGFWKILNRHKARKVFRR